MTDIISDAKELIATVTTLPGLILELNTAKANTHPWADDYSYWLYWQDVCTKAIELKRAEIPKRQYRGKVNLDDVRTRADIVEIASGYGIRLRKAGKSFVGLCPFHPEKTPSFHIYPDENRYCCFGCQQKGDFIDFIMRMENVGFKEAISKC